VLKELTASRKIVVLGDMLELGENAASAHRELAPFVAESGATLVVVVGRHMRALADVLARSGYGASRLVRLDAPDEAALFLKGKIAADDLVLIKGSRGMRMEFVTENLLFDPTEAGRYLCCQTPEWLARPFEEPPEWKTLQNDRTIAAE
jgi:UDP-N-acetylmuramyl pentapeptide synthase